MTNFNTRRRFIQITPFASLAFLAACSPKTEPPPVVVTVAPPAIAVPEPAQVAVTPTPDSVPAVAPENMRLVEKSDPQAVALGYVSDATQADKVKYKTYVAGSQCKGCSLYQGKAGDAAGPCPLFVGKKVSAIGWCSAWVKKA